MSRFCFGLLGLLLASTPAAAAFQYYDGGQVRQVATNTSPGAVEDVENTAATGFWTATASSTYTDTVGSASASASQISDLGDFEISMSGAVGGSGAAFDGVSGGYNGVGQSVLNAQFTLDSDSPYVSTLVSTTSVMSFNFSGAGASYDANSSGVLPAGDYALSIVFQEGNTVPGSASGAYAYNLSIAGVPEPSSALVFLVVGATLLVAWRRYGRL
jgi:hypothetical protein